MGNNNIDNGLTKTNLSIESLKNTIQEKDDFYVLRGIVRYLKGGKGRPNGFFFSRIIIMFFSEAVEDSGLPFSESDRISFIQTYLDYLEMRIIVLLPDDTTITKDQKEIIRRKFNEEYTFGAEDIKNRGAITLMKTMSSVLKETITKEEKAFDEETES